MTPELEVLARRAVACPRWQWLPGMRAVGRSSMPTAWFRLQGQQKSLHGEWRDAIPDFTDAATLGCLLEIYDQTRERRICPDSVYTNAAVYGLTHLKTIEALVAALEKT